MQVTPAVLSVHLGGSGEFRCAVTPQGNYLSTWLKDGRVLPGMSSGDTLLLTGVTREDQGMYQCVARRAEGETAQGTAELQLGGKVTLKLKINTMLFSDGIWEVQRIY